MPTSIEWTEETWNPTVGCDRISPGCAKCYAKALHDKRHTAALAGKAMAAQYAQPFEVLQMLDTRLDTPLRWRRPRKVFVNSVSDLFHADVPDAFIDQVFAVMALAPWHTFQILTKRAERMREYCSRLTFERVRVWMNRAADGDELTKPTAAGGFTPNFKENLTTIARRTKESVYRFDPSAMPMRTPPPPFPNVWLGVSCENQHFADERIPLLLQTPAAVRFISAEPLLGEINLAAWLPHAAIYIPAEPSPSGKSQVRCIRCGRVTAGMERECRTLGMMATLDWIICGGESGHGARPCCLSWIRNIVHDCGEARVACFVKQLGARPYETTADDGADGECRWPVGAELHLRSAKGGDPQEWPADLRVRQMPEGQ